MDEDHLRELLQSRFNLWDGEWFQKIQPLKWVKSVMNPEACARSAAVDYTIQKLSTATNTVRLKFRPTTRLTTIKDNPIDKLDVDTLSAIVDKKGTAGNDDRRPCPGA